MNFVFKLVLFTLTLNVSIGLMSNIFPVIYAENNPLGTYNPNPLIEAQGTLDKNLGPTNQLENLGDGFDRLMEKLGLSFMVQIRNFLALYMYGFVTIILERFLGLEQVYLNFFTAVITISYALGLFWLFTGKEMVAAT